MKVSLFIQPKPLPIPANGQAPCGWADIKFVDPRQIDQQQSTCIIGRGIEAIKVYFLSTIVGAHTSEKPSPTSGRVSIEILSGGALSKMKLKNVCPTGPSLQ